MIHDDRFDHDDEDAEDPTPGTVKPSPYWRPYLDAPVTAEEIDEFIKTLEPKKAPRAPKRKVDPPSVPAGHFGTEGEESE